ncbi:hypothetical protein OGAPHI_006018 [Ogataea philodendri]|uniref:Glutaredoxin domain-containing protein n=1 Tax=Ogataea philodendri TaxID=1378263 RepID=A0A9P8NYI1_9ASCO|nr:uncharacterized protein OGAPHI_006018 [Ogataea philodendri]KAH3661840.1 hypothetical protein OGAPHI_006018 [Ogataea philodendri]
MINARKQRVLAIAALCFLIILLVTVTGSGEKKPQVLAGERSYSPTPGNNKHAQAGGNVNELVRDKSGVIDESKVKQAEEHSNVKPPTMAPGGDTGKVKINADTSKKSGSSKEHLAIKEQNVAQELKDLKETKDFSSAKGSKDVEAKKPAKDTGAVFDPAKEFKEVLALSPFVIFSKSFCPYSKKLKDLLHSSYSITPQPAIVELDHHEHGKEFQAYLGEVSGRKTVPNLFVNGVSRGGCDEMVALHASNELLEHLVSWGGLNVKVEKINKPSNS